MNKALVSEDNLVNIANAIRDKLQTANTYSVANMAAAITSIPTNHGPKTITANGVYNAVDDALDGYNSVNVQVPIPQYNSGTFTATQNGTYNASDEGYDGFSSVEVAVPVTSYNSGSINIVANGEYDPADSGYDGFNHVSVNVPTGGGANLGPKTITTNGIYDPLLDGLDGYNSVTVQVPSGGGQSDFIVSYQVTNVAFMFSEHHDDYSNIFIDRNNSVNSQNMLLERTGDKALNIFCNNLSMLTGSGASSLIGKDLTWDEVTNGYYNSAYNIHLYNNYLGMLTDSSVFGKFQGNTSFDLGVKVADNVVNMGYMMNGCSGFNNSVQIGNSVTNCRSLLMDCVNYNQPIHIPASVTNARSMLWGCTNFNSPVTFDDAQYNIDLRGLFADTAFNLPITLPEGTRNVGVMFQNALFNQPIVIPDSVDAPEGLAYFMFNAHKFNCTLTIGNNIVNCFQMLDCFNGNGVFNQPIIFPKNVACANYALYGQQNMKSDIVLHNNACYYDWFLGNDHYEGNIYCPNGIWASRINNMLAQKNNTSGITSIYTPQSYSDYNSAIRSYRPTGNSDTWVGDQTNELVYSPTANIYIHCNWNRYIPNYFNLNYYSKNGESLLHQEQVWNGYNGTWSYGDDIWSDTPNGTPVTNIKNNITADKNIYYCGNVIYIVYTWAAQDSSPVNREWNFVSNQGQPVNAASVNFYGNNCWQMGTINMFVTDNGGSEVQLTNGSDYNVTWSGSNQGSANYILTADLDNRYLDSMRLQFDSVYRVNCSMNICTYDSL